MLTQAYRDRGFPVTVIRPSHTYDRTLVPMDGGWTFVERLRQGKEVVVHGDGSSLWTLTHHTDFARGFVPLLGNTRTLGEAFTITGDDVLTWDQIAQALATAAGTEARIVHVPSDQIAAVDPEWGSSLLGDKTWSSVFDTSKPAVAGAGLRHHGPVRAGRTRDRRLARRGPGAPGGRRARGRADGPARRAVPRGLRRAR